MTELDAANKVNRVYEDRAQSDEEVKERLRAELESACQFYRWWCCQLEIQQKAL